MPKSQLIRRASAQAAAIAVAAVTLLSASESLAQRNQRCSFLERELAAYEGVATGGPQVKGLNAAITKQQDALTRTDSHARRIGCFKRGFLFFQPSKPPECRKLEGTIKKMRRSLADLTARRDRIAGPARTNDPGKRRILQLLAANRCGPQYSQWAKAGRSRGLFGFLFEEDSGPREGYRGWFEDSRRTLGDVNTYRTLCVRTCDGYYFPISFATRAERFDQDAQQCRAMCPSAVVELFVHKNPGQTAEQMVSLSGRPYEAIPTAFQYRTEYVQGCSCNPYTLALEKAEAKQAEILAARGDATVSVPEIVRQSETGADAVAPSGETQGQPPFTATPAPGTSEPVNIFRSGDQESRFLAPLPVPPGGTEDAPAPNIFRMPPPGTAGGQRFQTFPERAPDEPFLDHSADR